MEVVMNVLPRRNWTRRCRDLLRGGVCVRARANASAPHNQSPSHAHLAAKRLLAVERKDLGDARAHPLLAELGQGRHCF